MRAGAEAEAPVEGVNASPPVITVVAVHGNGGGAHRFSLVTPEMLPGVVLHPITLPGFAAEPPDPALVTIQDYARCLGEFVAGVPRPRVVLGHGIGGSIALQLAQAPLPVLDGLILHAPVGANLDTRWFPFLMTLPGMRELGRRAYASTILRPLLRWMTFSGTVSRSYADQFFDEYGQCSVFGQMFDIITSAWFQRMQPVSVPSALVWGEAERVLGVEQVSEFRELLPDALVVTVPGWGHFPMAESPRSYADEISTLAQALVQGARAPSSPPAPATQAESEDMADAPPTDGQDTEAAKTTEGVPS